MQNANVMKCVFIEAKGAAPEIKQIPIPQISSGQVLIKVEYAPLNPSDINFMKGVYPCEKTFPCVPGFEGSGTIVVSGGGITGWGMAGKKVAFYTEHQFGSYAEYAVADAAFCLELDEDMPFDFAACAFINPLTVIAMLDICKSSNVHAVIHNPGASQLGRMMNRYFKSNGVKVINVVRKQEHIDLLKNEGVDLILDQNSPDYLEQLEFMAKATQAKIYFDAVSGEQTGQVLKVMPHGSTVHVYGRLSGQPIGQISVADLIFQKKSIHGFWVAKWIKDKNIITQSLFMRKLKALLKTQLFTIVSKEFTLDSFQDAMKYYGQKTSLGKVLLKLRNQFANEGNDSTEQSTQNKQQIDVPQVIKQEQIQKNKDDVLEKVDEVQAQTQVQGEVIKADQEQVQGDVNLIDKVEVQESQQ